jgi:Na+/proline symporter
MIMIMIMIIIIIIIIIIVIGRGDRVTTNVQQLVSADNSDPDGAESGATASKGEMS